MKKILLAVVMVLAMAVPAFSGTVSAASYRCTYCGSVQNWGGNGAPRDGGACMDNNWGPHHWVRVG